MTQQTDNATPGAIPLSNNQQFLANIFRTDANQAHVTVFHEDPSNLSGAGRLAWGGGHYGTLAPHFLQGGNQYFCISTFHPAEDGKSRRRKALFKQTHVIVVDDVGVGLSAKVDPLDTRLPVPSYKLETSPGNEQWGYILDVPETDRHRVDNLLDGMVAGKLCPDGSDPGMKGVTRYVRLPEGTNNKQKYLEVLGAPFQCVLNLWEPLRTYSLDTLAQCFSVDLDAERQDSEGITVDDEEHPALVAYGSLFGVKSKLGEGRYDVTCPNVHEHTDLEDSGTAIWTYPDGRLGYKCHHGHCEERGGGWLMSQMFAADPGLTERVAPFGSLLNVTQTPMQHPPEMPPISMPLDNDTQQPLDLHGMCMGLTHAADFNHEIRPLLAVIAQFPMESERDPYVQTIADQTGRRVMSLRNDVKRLIREARQALVVGGAVPEWAHVSDNDTPLSTLENFYALMKFYGIRDRYNEMTKSLEIQVPGEEFHTDTAKNAQILRMESLMIQHGMNPKQTVGWCNYAAQYDTYHPFREYLDTAGTWDGIDRIQMLADTLHVDPDKKLLRDTLLKRWLVSVCAAALRDTTLEASDTSESAPAPRGVFTLQGEQYMGKTRWFRRITPKTMFKEGLQLGSDKDTVKQATNCLIVEIGEADVSTKQEVGRVKAFISRDYDELRVPWDKAESRWPRRTVFGGSVNPARFLTDTTGNSRWWVVPVKTIDFTLLSFIDIKQLWLQAEALWTNGEPYLLTDTEMALLNDSNIAAQTASPFEEWLLDTFCFDDMHGQDIAGNWRASSELYKRAKDGGVPIPRDTAVTREILQRLTGSGNILRSINGTKGRFWKLPAARSMVTYDDEGRVAFPEDEAARSMFNT